MNPQPLQGDAAFNSFLAKCPWKATRFGALFPRRRETGKPDAPLLSVFLGRGVVPRSDGDGNNNRPGDDLSKYLVVQCHDLVFNKLRTWQGGFGVSQFDGIVSPAYFVCKPNDRIVPRFVHYLLCSHIYLSELTRISKWMPPSQFDIAWEDLRTLPIVTPNITTQQNISNFLDRETAEADALIAKYERLIELLEEQRVAVITQAVTQGLDSNVPLKASGIPCVQEIPSHWETRRLKFVARLRYGLGQPPPELDGGLPFIRATNVDKGVISEEGMVYVDPASVPESRNAFLKEGEILIVRSGALTGDSAIIPPFYEGAIAGFDIVITARDVDPRFLAASILMPFVRSAQLDVLKTRAAQPHLNVEDVGSVIIALPPRPEQERIIRFVAENDVRQKDAQRVANQAIQIAKEHRSALITAAVTGQIDVTTYRSKKQPIEVPA